MDNPRAKCFTCLIQSRAHRQNNALVDMCSRFSSTLATQDQLVVDQMQTVRSSPKDATYDPTGSHATPLTKLSWAGRTATACPSTVSHIMTSVSKLQEAKRALSGDHARPVTPSLCRLQLQAPTSPVLRSVIQSGETDRHSHEERQ